MRLYILKSQFTSQGNENQHYASAEYAFYLLIDLVMKNFFEAINHSDNAAEQESGRAN
jgi:hypothetical protein